MPGFILHITAAKILFNKYNLEIDRDAFSVGNLIPDSVSDKTWSHFRHSGRQEKLIVYPDLDLFFAKYKNLLTDSSCLGYYFHLFIDHVYALEYLPQLVSFSNDANEKVSDRKDITYALIKRTNERIPIKTFFSDEYYYGDFTKLNTYLINRFHLSTDLKSDVKNPGITEVNYEDISIIHKQLLGYLDIPERAIDTLQVFEPEHFIDFLEMAVDRFAEMIKGHSS